jgi:DNA-binding XRE family transcriptional regulator
MATMTGARCEHCGDYDVRLDENGWCEQCWLGLRPAYQLFYELEELVKQALDAGVLTSAQLQDALRMSLADEDGALTGTGFRREPVETDERGIWHVPPSAFDSDPPGRRNRIALLRRMARLSLEAVAEKIGVPAEEVALWEQDALPTDEHAAAAAAMCALFCASPAFVFGLEGEA